MQTEHPAPSLFTPRARRSVQITFKFTEAERDALREYAQRFDISQAQLIRSAVAAYVAERRADQAAA